MPQLLIATRNAHKTAEIRAMLGAGWKVTDLNAHPGLPSPDESGSTFAENAIIKALAASRAVPGLVLADDSGLEVDGLAGLPGVRSARYAGEESSDAENRAKLLRELQRCGARGAEHAARFRSVIALSRNGEVLGTFDGTVDGVVIEAERGSGGFGYDSLFVPEGHQETFAQLPAEVKNTLSHRARALAKLLPRLRELSAE